MSSKRQELRDKRRRQQNQQRILWYGLIGAAVLAVVALLIVPNLIPPPDTSGLTRGSVDAPVKIVEFSDFQCPSCKVFNDQRMAEQIEPLIESGQVQFTYTPVAFIGPESISAAKAAYCANEQGKFWEYHALLFANQTGENVGDFEDDKLVAFAQELSLDPNNFQRCLSSRKYATLIQDNMATWNAAGLSSTPSFTVNGKPVLSDTLEAEISAALGQ